MPGQCEKPDGYHYPAADQFRSQSGSALHGAYDQGEEYTASETKIGSSIFFSTLATDVPVKATTVVPKILSSTRKFTRVTCSVYGEGYPGGTIPIEFRNVAISWK